MATAMQQATTFGQRKKMGWLRKQFVKSEMKQLSIEIEKARATLVRNYDEVGDFQHPSVVIVSRILDALINHYQRLDKEIDDKPPPTDLYWLNTSP